VMSAGSLINLYCLRIYRPATGRAIDKSTRWLEKFAFSPELLGGFSYWLLGLVSFLALFFELLMIRWISSEIGIFAYLKNFVLIACFLGFGLGCYLSRLRINLVATLMPLMALTLICTLPWSGLRGLVDTLPNLLGPASRVDVWGLPSFPRSVAELFMLASAVLFIVPSFGLIACSMIPLGQLVGWCLENAKNGISAYTVNIIGSLAGIVLFTLLSFMFLPPAIWFLLAGASAAGMFWRLPSLRWTCVAVFLTCAGLASLGPGKGSKVFWSPYQKLTVTAFRQNGEIVSYGIKSNTSWQQQIFNLSPDFVASHPWFFKIFPAEYNPYNRRLALSVSKRAGRASVGNRHIGCAYYTLRIFSTGDRHTASHVALALLFPRRRLSDPGSSDHQPDGAVLRNHLVSELHCDRGYPCDDRCSKHSSAMETKHFVHERVLRNLRLPHDLLSGAHRELLFLVGLGEGTDRCIYVVLAGLFRGDRIH